MPYGIYVRKRIFTWESFERRFWEKVGKTETDGCWLWGGTVFPKNGYGECVFRKKSFYAHRMAWRLTHGDFPPSGIFVCHRCDNRICVNPSHLFAGTAADNNRDMKEKGRMAVGERHPNSKLSDDQRKQIVCLYKTGEISHAKLAEQYGVTRRNVGRIIEKYGF